MRDTYMKKRHLPKKFSKWRRTGIRKQLTPGFYEIRTLDTPSAIMGVLWVVINDNNASMYNHYYVVRACYPFPFQQSISFNQIGLNDPPQEESSSGREAFLSSAIRHIFANIPTEPVHTKLVAEEYKEWPDNHQERPSPAPACPSPNVSKDKDSPA